ncbi:MAG: NAD(P)/FAD-dependent oxidoreductase, partial [Dehalococcoidia bacterium]
MSIGSAEVTIIGGGVSGLSSGYYLAKAGMDVVVIEKEIVGSESSARNGGLISAAVDQGAVAPTVVESLKMWPTLDKELGYPTEFVGQGRLRVAFTEEHMEDIFQAAEDYRRFGLGAKVVDSQEARDMVPGLSERVLGGLFTPDAGHANPQQTVEAFARAFEDRGGRLYQRTAVMGINVKDGRVSSVETSAGPIATEFVISAAGPQTSLIADMAGVHVPSAPAKIECIVTVPLEPLFDIVLTGNGLYGRQTLRGNLQFGGGPVEWIDVR